MLLQQVRLFFIALQFLTRVPIPRRVGFEPAWLNASARYFPLVGTAVGAVAAIVLWASASVFPPAVAAWLSITATVLLTGAFHEDGLADTCDALGGSVGRERALEIMKDSRIGSYGAVGLVIVLATKATTLAALLPDWAVPASIVAHTVSRAVPVLLIRWLPYAGSVAHAKAKPLARSVSRRDVGVALVTSIQPKRSLEDRKQFVVSLPGLMSELTAGMKFVEWPQAAQDEFFGELISQHSGSLKSTARSDLDHNMMVRTLEAAFRIPVPSTEEASAEPEPESPESKAPVVEQRFSASEGEAIGLISESEIDWSRHPANEARAALARRMAEEEARQRATPPPAPGTDSIDIPLDPVAPGGLAFPVLLSEQPPGKPADAAEVDIALEEPVESPEFAPGPQLREHLQLGFSYQLNLKDQWEKVRLTYMSPGRTLFLFAHGAKGRETISMTSRTLARLCEGGRMRAFENAFLIDRATQRARQQLAAIGGRSGAATAAA